MRVVALYRVSTERQGTDGASLDAQERRYREVAAAQGWETVAEHRGAESATGATADRALLQRVLSTVRDERVEALWVYEQSRLTRGDELEVLLLVRELREREIVLYVDTRRVDLDDESDGLTFGVMSLVDRLEVQKFRRRAAAGREEKARRGKRAVGKAPYGYRNPPPGDSRRGTLQVFEPEADTVRSIFALAADGVSQRGIARRLNAAAVPAPRGSAWSKTSITRILQNRAYLGHAVARAWVRTGRGRSHRLDLSNARAIIVENAHAALVSAQTWELAHQRDGRRGGRPALCTGLLWIEGRRANVVHCRDRGPQYRSLRESGHGLSTPTTDALVWAGFLSLLRSPEHVAALLEQAVDADALALVEGEVEAAERDAGRLRVKLDRLTEMRLGGELDRSEYLERRDGIGRDLRAAQGRSLALRQRLGASRESHRDRWQRAAQVLAVASKLEPERRRELLTALIERIDVTLLDRGPQQHATSGAYLPRTEPRWGIADAVAVLRSVDPASIRQSASQFRVTVQIIKYGRVVEPEARPSTGRKAKESA